MTSKAEKARRRQIVRGIRAQEHAAAEASRPLAKSTLRGLLPHLEGILLARLDDGTVVTRCNHSLLHTMAYLTARGEWDESLVHWFGEYGGFCDCEIMFNVFDYWTPERLSE